MRILAIDTSGLVAAVAVTEDGTLLAEYRTQYRKTHSQMLVPMLEAVRQSIDLDLATLDYIAVAAGPGSFTGLRIGAATAKGMAFALGIPLVPVSTLEALAWQLVGEPGLICPIMDARRGQVYTAVYQTAGAAEPGAFPPELEVLREPCAASVEELADWLTDRGGSVVFLGDGVPVYQELLAERMGIPYRLSPLWKNRQSAAALAALAEEYVRRGRTVDADAFAPVYLRASQAEREAAERKAAERRAIEARDAAGRPRELSLRRMRPEEAEAEAAREALCMGAEAWSPNLLREAADRRDCVYLVAVWEGRPVGHAGIRHVLGEGEITNVCVDAAYRRRGVGEALLRQLLAEGRSLGIGDCTLEVRKANAAAIALYEKVGFRREGVRPGFYERPADDAVIFWLRG